MKSNKSIPRNAFQYEYLASEYFIAASPLLDQCSHKAHDLYNRALYDLRQGFFKRKYVKGYSQLDQLFKERYAKKESLLYHDLLYVQFRSTDFKRSQYRLVGMAQGSKSISKESGQVYWPSSDS